MESAVSERRKAFAAAHRGNEDRQAYISASHRASSVIAKAETEVWQTTCSSLSPRSNPKSVHSLLRSIAGSPSSPSSTPNFPNCSSPRESASVYVAYLRSHFSVSQPKTLIKIKIQTQKKIELSSEKKVNTCVTTAIVSLTVQFIVRLELLFISLK